VHRERLVLQAVVSDLVNLELACLGLGGTLVVSAPEAVAAGAVAASAEVAAEVATAVEEMVNLRE